MRILGVVLILCSMTPALSAVASGEENVRDDFGSVSYSNNDGSRPWAGPWREVGESDGAGSGQIQVQGSNCSNNRCLLLRGGHLLSSVSVTRKADLSGFSTAELRFDLDLDGPAISTGFLSVDVRGNGKGWTNLETYSLLAKKGKFSVAEDVHSFAGADFELRFHLSGILGADMAHIDKVEVRGQVIPPTTTTTTTSTSTSTTSTTTTTTRPAQPGSAPPPTTSTTSGGSATTTSTSTTVESPSESGTADDPGDAEPGTGDPTSTTIVNEEPESQGVIGPGGPPGPPPGSGLRVSTVGVMADYRTGSAEDVEVEVLGAELEADFSLAVETFETARIWLAVLSLLIAAAVVSGMDRKRSGQSPA